MADTKEVTEVLTAENSAPIEMSNLGADTNIESSSKGDTVEPTSTIDRTTSSGNTQELEGKGSSSTTQQEGSVIAKKHATIIETPEEEEKTYVYSDVASEKEADEDLDSFDSDEEDDDDDGEDDESADEEVEEIKVYFKGVCAYFPITLTMDEIRDRLNVVGGIFVRRGGSDKVQVRSLNPMFSYELLEAVDKDVKFMLEFSDYINMRISKISSCAEYLYYLKMEALEQEFGDIYSTNATNNTIPTTPINPSSTASNSTPQATTLIINDSNGADITPATTTTSTPTNPQSNSTKKSKISLLATALTNSARLKWNNRSDQKAKRKKSPKYFPALSVTTFWIMQVVVVLFLAGVYIDKFIHTNEEKKAEWDERPFFEYFVAPVNDWGVCCINLATGYIFLWNGHKWLTKVDTRRKLNSKLRQLQQDIHEPHPTTPVHHSSSKNINGNTTTTATIYNNSPMSPIPFNKDLKGV